MSAISFVDAGMDGFMRVVIAYRDEVRGARIDFDQCTLHVTLMGGATFNIVLLDSDESTPAANDQLSSFFALAHEMLADLTCFDADIDIVWVLGDQNPAAYTRHENTRVTREILQVAKSNAEATTHEGR